MQIRKDENGNIIQVASMGGIPDGTELDLSDYRMDENGNLLLDTEKIQAKQNAARAEEIKIRLEEIDGESVRPLRADVTGTADDYDVKKLKELEAEAEELREELRTLNGGDKNEKQLFCSRAGIAAGAVYGSCSGACGICLLC